MALLQRLLAAELATIADCGAPAGVYVSASSADSPAEWRVTLFAGAPAFDAVPVELLISFTAQYPQRPPRVFVVTQGLLHPLVDAAAPRELHYHRGPKVALPALEVLCAAKRCFVDVGAVSEAMRGAGVAFADEGAAELLRADELAFTERSRESLLAASTGFPSAEQDKRQAERHVGANGEEAMRREAVARARARRERDKAEQAAAGERERAAGAGAGGYVESAGRAAASWGTWLTGK